MVIVELIRYLFGYINFRAYGGLADRFLNLCTKERIPLWNIKNIKGNIYASTTVYGYLLLKNPARKSGMKLVAVEKKGLKFTLIRNKAKVGILAGLVAFIAIIVVLSQFVWSVSIIGNTTVDNETILSAFENQGVCVGAKISSVDAKLSAQKVVAEIEELSWAAVNRKGSVVVIEVREKVIAPEIYDDKTPTNLIAGEDGVILSIDVLNGLEEVKPGSAVAKGDLLVNGIITHADGRETPVHADGYVKARVNRNRTFTGDEITLFPLEKENKRSSVFFFGLKIPLGLPLKNERITQHQSFLESEKMLLPIGIITGYGADYADTPTQVGEDYKNKLALFGNANYIKGLLEYSEVETSRLSVKNTCEYTLNCECVQEIGVLQEIYVEKSDDIE